MAQEGLQLMLPQQDSTELEMERRLEYYRLINGNAASDFFMSELKLPGMDFAQEFARRYSLNPAITDLPSFTFIPPADIFGPSPFLMNAQILGGSVTQLNNKFVIGGFQYGANFPMSTPLPNAPGTQFDSYGSTMFMQYKVSKNFKIETRVTVGQNQGPPPPPGF